MHGTHYARDVLQVEPSGQSRQAGGLFWLSDSKEQDRQLVL